MNNYEDHMRFPKHISARDLDISYYEFGDILIIYFEGPPHPAINVPAPAELFGLDWRVDADSNEVIGMEIHGFLETFLPHFPEAKVFAQLASIPDELVEVSLAKANETSRDRLAFFAITEEIGSLTGSLSS